MFASFCHAPTEQEGKGEKADLGTALDIAFEQHKTEQQSTEGIKI